jgi:2-dehydro-3-deoxygluconokinase
MERIYKYDAVALGEVMLRLDPGEERIRTARNFKVWEGGGEYNVIKGLKKCFGLNTAMITALAENETGFLLEDLIMQGGVDTELICWKETDGVGKKCRNGINFTEKGFGIRGMLGCSDRANTAVSQLKAEDIDFDRIFGEMGVQWLHTGGIFAALSPNSVDIIERAIEKAHQYGATVSYDLNFRASLWSEMGNADQIIALNRRIASKVDVLIGNESEFSVCLGIKEPENPDKTQDVLNQKGFEYVLLETKKQYKNLKAIAAVLHQSESASKTSLVGVGLMQQKIYRSKSFYDIDVFDAVGAGDAFGSGVIYGLMKLNDMQAGLDYGVANSAYVMTTPGDTTMAKKYELDAVLKNGCASQNR